MQVNLSYEDGYALAATDGPIDESCAQVFRELLHPLVSEHGARLVIDLSQSARVNSEGLGQIVKLVVNANTHSSRVILAAPTPFVDSVFAVTKLRSFLNVEPSVSLAVEAVLAKSAPTGDA